MNEVSDNYRLGQGIAERLDENCLAGTIDFLSSLDSQLPEYLVAGCFGEVFAKSTLDLQHIEICVMSSLITQMAPNQLTWHIGAALHAGVPLKKILGVCIHSLPYVGWPRAITALRTLHNVVLDKGKLSDLEQVIKENSEGSLGTRDTNPITADTLHKVHPNWAENKPMDSDIAAYYEKDMFGRIYSRSDLSLKERALSTLAILTSDNQWEELEGYISTALNADCSTEEIKDIFFLMHKYVGWPTAMKALKLLEHTLK